MSGAWEWSAALALAQLQGMLTRADTGAGSSRIALYWTARPASITTAHTDTPQAEITLQTPCGTIVGGTLVLKPQVTTGAMIQSNGQPRWAEWFAADGVLLTRCSVTDNNNDGGIRVAGGLTPDGDNSPLLYAGGLVVLSQVVLT